VTLGKCDSWGFGSNSKSSSNARDFLATMTMAYGWGNGWQSSGPTAAGDSFHALSQLRPASPIRRRAATAATPTELLPSPTFPFASPSVAVSIHRFVSFHPFHFTGGVVCEMK
jgi:hypothetical protein